MGLKTYMQRHRDAVQGFYSVRQKRQQKTDLTYIVVAKVLIIKRCRERIFGEADDFLSPYAKKMLF
jgi:hypothetical protein